MDKSKWSRVRKENSRIEFERYLSDQYAKLTVIQAKEKIPEVAKACPRPYTFHNAVYRKTMGGLIRRKHPELFEKLYAVWEKQNLLERLKEF